MKNMGARKIQGGSSNTIC